MTSLWVVAGLLTSLLFFYDFAVCKDSPESRMSTLLAVHSWNTKRQIQCTVVGLSLSGSAWLRRDGDSWFNSSICWSRARQSRARQDLGRDAAKLSLRACMTPKLVVFEAVIYPNKARPWFCRLAQISEPYSLAG